MQSLLSCVVLNTTEMQTQKEACEEMTRGMPRCSKYEWRHNRDKREREKKIVGFCTDFGFCPVGSCSAGGFLPPIPGEIYPKELADSFSV